MGSLVFENDIKKMLKKVRLIIIEGIMIVDGVLVRYMF